MRVINERTAEKPLEEICKELDELRKGFLSWPKAIDSLKALSTDVIDDNGTKPRSKRILVNRDNDSSILQKKVLSASLIRLIVMEGKTSKNQQSPSKPSRKRKSTNTESNPFL
jgi:hypothetical protein